METVKTWILLCLRPGALSGEDVAQAVDGIGVGGATVAYEECGLGRVLVCHAQDEGLLRGTCRWAFLAQQQ